ncbi:MAG: ribonuclease HII [Deltaproteobacteria bacterium]|nr:ribonuclease HII [Deltaproteobacteria bacterium]
MASGSRQMVLRLDAAPGEEGPVLGWGERWARSRGLEAICGVDEVGRGPLAGPVVAAAVVLPRPLEEALCAEGLDDSKKLDARRRERLDRRIREGAAWGLAEVDVETIDRINILQASQLAMRRAIDDLAGRHPGVEPACLLVDGHLVLEPSPLPRAVQRAVVKGDSRSVAIAAASVVAKVHRDALMVTLNGRYPGYDLARNKGYPTKVHREALAALGPTPIHRRSFKGVLPEEGASE